MELKQRLKKDAKEKASGHQQSLLKEPKKSYYFIEESLDNLIDYCVEKTGEDLMDIDFFGWDENTQRLIKEKIVQRLQVSVVK